MMRICLPFLLLWTSIIGDAAAQGPLTSKAIEQAQSGQVNAAAATIEDATQGLEGNDPMTWYVKAFIHKTLYVVGMAGRPDHRQGCGRGCRAALPNLMVQAGWMSVVCPC